MNKLLRFSEIKITNIYNLTFDIFATHLLTVSSPGGFSLGIDSFLATAAIVVS